MYFIKQNSAAKASEYFAKIGYPCEEQVNPAEHFMQIVSSETLYYKLDPAQKEELESMDDNEIQMKYKDLIAEFARKYNVTTEYKCDEEYVCPGLSNLKNSVLQHYNAPWWKQYTMLTTREIKRISSEKRIFVAKLTSSLILVVCMIMLFHNMGISGYNGFQNFVGFLTLISMNLIIVGVNNSVEGFPTQRMIFMREQASGQYGVLAYYLAYFTGSIPFALFLPSLYILIGFLVTFMINGIELTMAKVLVFCKCIIKGVRQ